MRRRHLFWVALVLALCASACTTLQPPRLDTAKACTEWRWIGISRPGARCPEIQGWTVRPLFPQLSPASCKESEYGKAPDAELIQDLNRFCVYEPAAGKGTKGLPFPPSASADLVKLDQDCAAMYSTDRELDPKDWKADPRDFIPPEPESRIDARRSVRLAFLDTQPTGEGVPMRSGNSPHGFTLAHLARQLLCEPGSSTHCAALITTRLALPIVKFDPTTFKKNEIDTTHGGHIGLQSDLAQAIRDEVDAWLRAKAQKHLILNLSVAWDGNLFGGLGQEQIEEMRAGTQAVYYALQYAAGYDVLVLAAAGNQRIEPCSNYGPLLPAAWEKDAPQDGSCPLKEKQKQIVYAVGGVQDNGVRLANARPGGMPQRAAYGETAVLLGVDPETVYKEKIYSGSSVATAYASAIAAAVWSSSPDEIGSREVMVRLDGSGCELFPADFWFGDKSETRLTHLLTLGTGLGEKKCDSLKLNLAAPSRFPGAEVSSRGSCQPWLHPQPDDPPCLNQSCPPKRN